MRADVNFLDFDGGLGWMPALGVMVALQHFEKPDVSMENHCGSLNDERRCSLA